MQPSPSGWYDGGWVSGILNFMGDLMIETEQLKWGKKFLTSRKELYEDMKEKYLTMCSRGLT